MEKLKDFVSSLNLDTVHPVVLGFAGIGVLSCISLAISFVF